MSMLKSVASMVVATSTSLFGNTWKTLRLCGVVEMNRFSRV
jgi:hypothetical protein